MAPATLCGLNECRIVHFMIHDRASFGAVLISLATLYTWLALFPLIHNLVKTYFFESQESYIVLLLHRRLG